MNSVTELLLYEAARSQLIAEIIIPALKALRLYAGEGVFESHAALLWNRRYALAGAGAGANSGLLSFGCDFGTIWPLLSPSTTFITAAMMASGVVTMET